MTSPPDKIFRDGLGQYQKKAPLSAWDRIETNLDHKRNRSPWMKIAAGLLLLIAASIMIWKQDQNVSSNQAAVGSEQLAVSSEQATMSSEQVALDSLKSSPSNSIVEHSRNEPSSGSQKSKATSPQSNVSSLQSPVSNLQSENTPSVAHLEEGHKTDEILTEPAPIAQAENTTEAADNVAPAEIRRASITYTAEAVNEKFMKKVSTAQATPEKKNTSGLQRVIDRALDLKFDESVLGELKEKKNEWLSLNIPSHKREINK